MKKLTYLLLIFLSSVFFVSCSDDDNLQDFTSIQIKNRSKAELEYVNVKSYNSDTEKYTMIYSIENLASRELTEKFPIDYSQIKVVYVEFKINTSDTDYNTGIYEIILKENKNIVLRLP